MSMHKKPLTAIEEAGLIAHGFGRDIGKPSMTADIFRHGVTWGQMSEQDKIAGIQKQLDHRMPFQDNLRNRLTELLPALISLPQAQQPTKFQALSDAQIVNIAKATFEQVEAMPDFEVNGDTWDICFARNILTSQTQKEPETVVELENVPIQIEGGYGLWNTCSGCHETEDGHSVGSYQYSSIFNCLLGSGCHECGGIGVIWETFGNESLPLEPEGE